MKERLQLIIQQSGLSNRKFSESLGLSANAISEIVNGRANLNQQSLLLIRNQYGVNIDWLLTGDGEMFLPLPRPLSETGRGVTASKFNYRLDEEERELIDLLRSKKTGTQKVIVAVKALLGLGVLLFVFMR